MKREMLTWVWTIKNVYIMIFTELIITYAWYRAANIRYDELDEYEWKNLIKKWEISTDFGKTLSGMYLCYVKENSIT